MHPWQLIACVPEDVIVLTKVDDDQGGHNMCRLRFHDGLWYLSGGGMRVDCTPTHWRVEAMLSEKV